MKKIVLFILLPLTIATVLIYAMLHGFTMSLEENLSIKNLMMQNDIVGEQTTSYYLSDSADDMIHFKEGTKNTEDPVLVSATDIKGEESFFKKIIDTEYDLEFSYDKSDPDYKYNGSFLVTEKARDDVDGVVTTPVVVPYSLYIADPFNFAKLYKSGFLNLDDSNTFLIADEDMDILFGRLLKQYKASRAGVQVSWPYLQKYYKYLNTRELVGYHYDEYLMETVPDYIVRQARDGDGWPRVWVPDYKEGGIYDDGLDGHELVLPECWDKEEGSTDHWFIKHDTNTNYVILGDDEAEEVALKGEVLADVLYSVPCFFQTGNSDSFAGSTISAKGCSLISGLMILNAYSGQTYSDVYGAYKSNKNGMNAGSSGISLAALYSYYGYGTKLYKNTGAGFKQAMMEELSAGHLLSVYFRKNSGTIRTSGGHFVTVIGYSSADRTFYVNSPNKAHGSSTIAVSWDEFDRYCDSARAVYGSGLTNLAGDGTVLINDIEGLAGTRGGLRSITEKTNSSQYWFLDLLDERDADDNMRWTPDWQLTLACLSYLSTYNYNNWSYERSGEDYHKYKFDQTDNYYFSDEDIEEIVDAFDYDFQWYFSWIDYEPYKEWLEDYQNDGECPEDLEPLEVENWQDFEKYSYKLDKREIGVEVDLHPAGDDEAYIKKTPYNAPYTISNLYEYVEYVYADVDDGYGKKICVGRDRYIDGIAFYNFMYDRIGDEFDWDALHEVLEQFPSADASIQKLEEIKLAYDTQMETGVSSYKVADCETENAAGDELPHLYVRLGTECEEDVTIPSSWFPDPTLSLSDEDLKNPGVIFTDHKEFIEEIAAYAQTLMSGEFKDCGVLPSVLIAQACLESGYGTSKKMIDANAVFGIKATASWNGKVYNTKTREVYDNTSTVITAGFRAYDSLYDSCRDYVKLITNSSRYSGAVNNPSPTATIQAIKNGGYATDPKYVDSVLKIIKKYDLTRYDN